MCNLASCKCHEVYSECNGSPSCNPSCDKPTGPFFCNRMCNPGCICKEGYVLDPKGECILLEDCPSSSVENVAWFF